MASPIRPKGRAAVAPSHWVEDRDSAAQTSSRQGHNRRPEIEGLVKAASSYALTRCVDVKDLSKALDVSRLIVEYEDFERALMDIEPKFGAKSQQLKAYYCNGFVPYEDSFDYLMGTMERLVEQGTYAPAYGLH